MGKKYWVLKRPNGFGGGLGMVNVLDVSTEEGRAAELWSKIEFG